MTAETTTAVQTTASIGSRFITRTAPVFDDVATERRHRLERLAGVCRIFGRLGFAEGLLGHITVRDPEFADLLWVNPMGVSFRKMTVSDLVQVAAGPGARAEGCLGSAVGGRVRARIGTAVAATRWPGALPQRRARLRSDGCRSSRCGTTSSTPTPACSTDRNTMTSEPIASRIEAR